VLKETDKAARLAEAEWKRSPRHAGLSQFAADRAVEMRPGPSGINIIVRYVTRASERREVRNRLYERVIEILNPQAKALPL
jgi:small-conductance mechanosensitive channel